MELKEILEFVEANKSNDEVKAIFKKLYTVEDVLKDTDYSKTLNSWKDSEISKAVDSFQKNTLPKKIEEELAKKAAQSAKPEWQIEIENLKQELAKKEKESIIANQKTRALKYAQEKGLPVDIIDPFLGLSDEETDQKLNTLSSVFDTYTTKIKQEILKGHNIQVPENGNKFTQSISKEINLPENASKEEWKAAYAAQAAAERSKNSGS
jgi:hypothetical protein